MPLTGAIVGALGTTINRASSGSILYGGSGITRRALISSTSGGSIRYSGKFTLLSSRGSSCPASADGAVPTSAAGATDCGWSPAGGTTAVGSPAGVVGAGGTHRPAGAAGACSNATGAV